jgi:branched-chain amino acid transport system permease protein
MPIAPWLANVQIDVFSGMLIGGLVAALFAVIIGLPILHLGDDYLGIATLGFAEIIKVFINNMQDVTNGSLGIKGLPDFINTYWCFGIAILAVLFAVRLSKTSRGRAFKAIRENEIAAQASGIKLTRNKVLSFVFGAFMAGIGGALLGYWSSTIDPKMFSQAQNFTILMIVVTGGLGNITGTVIMSFVVAIGMEWLRFMEEPMDILGLHYEGIPGMRMLVFSILLLVVITRFKRGLFNKEFTPSMFYTRPKFLDKFKKKVGGGK